MTVEKLSELKQVDSDLLEVIKANLEKFNESRDDERDPFEYFDFSIENTGFAFVQTKCSNWDDQGKYQYQEQIGQFVAYDKSIAGYPCKRSIVEEYNLFGSVSCSRSGSYYSDYYYSYEPISLFVYDTERVTEVVIPEHDVLRERRV